MLFTQSLTSAWNLWITEATKKSSSRSIHSKSRQLIPLKEKNVSFPGGWAGSFVSKDASFPIPVSLDCFFFYSFFKMFWFIVCVGYGGTTTNLRAWLFFKVRESAGERQDTKGRHFKLYPSSRVTWQRWVAHSSFFVLFFKYVVEYSAGIVVWTQFPRPYPRR